MTNGDNTPCPLKVECRINEVNIPYPLKLECQIYEAFSDIMYARRFSCKWCKHFGNCDLTIKSCRDNSMRDAIEAIIGGIPNDN